MILFGFPPMLLGDALLELQRAFDLPFFDPKRGGDPLLWQHLFWLFGHPEVYIIFLPAAGIVSMILPTFARHPFVGYSWAVMAAIGVGFISFALWAHHMFTTGLPHLSLSFFSAASLAVVVPNGIQFFCWIATLWSGRPVLRLPMLYLVGFFSVFLVGGLTGVMVAVVPFDWQAHDSYFVVAHLHYVLIGGMVFPLLAGIVYWLPLVSGRMMPERAGRLAFWLLFVGFNVAFLPMHWTGLVGMPRRVYSYPADAGWGALNMVSTVGAAVLAAGFLVFLKAAWSGMRNGPVSGPNPWNAGTLEWLEGTPMPAYSVSSVPVVTSRYPLWDQPELGEHVRAGRYHLAEAHRGRRETIVTTAVDALPDYVLRLPGPTFVPLLAAVATTVCFVALTFKAVATGIAAGVVTILLFYLWVWRTEAPVDERIDIGRGTTLPAYASGPTSVVHGGTVVGLIFDAVAYGALLFSYLYLFVVRGTPWPPEGVAPFDATAAAWAAVAFVAASIAGAWSLRMLRRDRRLLAAAGTVAIAALHAVGGVAFVSAAGAISATDDAYGAVIWTIVGFGAAHAAVVVAMTPYLLVAFAAGRLGARRPLAMEITVMVGHYASAVALVGLATIAFFPELVGHA
jgi:cytochrome c oxidase subunit I+III